MKYSGHFDGARKPQSFGGGQNYYYVGAVKGNGTVCTLLVGPFSTQAEVEKWLEPAKNYAFENDKNAGLFEFGIHVLSEWKYTGKYNSFLGV